MTTRASAAASVGSLVRLLARPSHVSSQPPAYAALPHRPLSSLVHCRPQQPPATAMAAAWLQPPKMPSMTRRAISVKATRRQQQEQQSRKDMDTPRPLKGKRAQSAFTPSAAVRPANLPLDIQRACGVLVRSLVESNYPTALAQFKLLLSTDHLSALSVEELVALFRLIVSHQTPSSTRTPDPVVVHDLDLLMDVIIMRAKKESARYGGPSMLPTSMFTALMQCHGWLQETEASESIWNYMVGAGMPLTTDTLNALLRAYAADGSAVAADSLIETCLRNKTPKPDLDSYLILLDAYANALSRSDSALRLQHLKETAPNASGDAAAASATASADTAAAGTAAAPEDVPLLAISKVLDRVLEQGLSLNIQLFNHLITAFAKAGQPDRMLQVRSMMESRNFLPSTVTYNNLIHGFIVAGNHAEAVETFQAMMADAASSLDRRSQCAPDLATYNILIDMYAKLSDATSAAQMLDQMTKHGIAPDVVSFNTVMDAYRRIGDTENVRFYFDAIGRQAMRPTEVSHNILISAYGFNGEPGIAQELFKQMYAKGVYPRRFTFGTMIAISGLQGDFAGAMAMFERMQYSGIKPDARIYAMLMQAAVRSSVGLAKVDDVFKMAESDGHVNRDVCHWLMLAALADGTRPLAEVVQAVYVDEMQIRKIAPTVQTLDMLIDAVMRPSRLLELHDGLVHQKYRTLSKMGYAGAVGGAGSAIAAKTSSVSTNVDGGTAGKSANASALERVVRDLQTAGHRLSDRQRSRIAAAARRLSAQ